ncbi:hypothetical protein LA76x_5167 [Lysobacter antibioticus]|uniref:Uncharacterized protein n=1 Tax=Lysobacter antibioticus TaxID=84531 RepID=A0A0S2FID3_LYSAN|nr:hypothetical protein LA76x_5167 [Lysobacter antibioticus]
MQRRSIHLESLSSLACKRRAFLPYPASVPCESLNKPVHTGPAPQGDEP